jgi:choline kinase
MDKSLDNKRKYIAKDGEEYLNLFSPTVNINNIKTNGYIKVNQDCKGRIDKFVYTNVSKDYNSIDLLMYVNHIYNPFSINDGDILYTPIYNDELFSKTEEPVLPDGSTLSTKNKPSMTYAEKVAILAKKGKGWK